MKVKNITSREIWKAKQRIKPYVIRTALTYSHELSELTGSNIYIKFENLQEIGAFKIRGAANKILSLTAEQKAKGISTFSTGNHGLAVAYMANRLGMKATVCMSKHVPSVKVNKISRYNPVVLQEWDSQDAAGTYCFKLQEEEGVTVIPPYDDKEIICGQGTIGLEIVEDCPEVDMVLVPLSGGGLMSGVTLGLKMTIEDVKVVGISMKESAVMIESLKAGHPVEMSETPTLADSLLGGIGLDNQYTYDIVKDYVDQTAQVSEEEIAEGIRYIMRNHKMIVEGAGAVGIAYALRQDNLPKGKNIVIVVTGNGVGMETIKNILNDTEKL